MYLRPYIRSVQTVASFGLVQPSFFLHNNNILYLLYIINSIDTFLLFFSDFSFQTLHGITCRFTFLAACYDAFIMRAFCTI